MRALTFGAEMKYAPGTRTGIEAKRLRRCAADAGLDDTALWYEACHAARLAADHGRADLTPLVIMRRLLDEQHVQHDALDAFGTTESRTA